MPLVSLLLRDEPRLQACLVADTAHVVPGAAGRHVGLIQKVLLVLEKANISAGELRSGLYGPTTTAAVLAYKRKRDIVNRTYQTTADNIVGKMTIAKMDDELMRLDLRALSGRVVCTGGGHAPPPRPAAIVGAGQAGLVGGPTPFKPNKQRPARLRIIVQKTNRAREFGDPDGLLAELYKRARELLAPHGMDFTTGAATPGFGPEVIDAEKVIAGSAASCGSVMESALRALADRPDALRVIFCPFSDTGDAFGVTDGGPNSALTVPRFCLINVRKRRGDLGTLLHEMVHAARPEMVAPDVDIKSVFSEAGNRSATELPERHAESIVTSFFGR